MPEWLGYIVCGALGIPDSAYRLHHHEIREEVKWLSSAVVRKFLDATSETLEVIDLRTRRRVSPIFLIMLSVIVVLTSFTTSSYVVVLTLVASVVILAITHNLRSYARRLFSALVYACSFFL